MNDSTPIKPVKGGRYNRKGQPERLVYMGVRHYGMNGAWNQFAKVDEPDVCWCEVRESELSSFEETPAPALSEPATWQPIGTAHKHGDPVWLFDPALIDAEANPTGTVDGHWQDDSGWMGAVWSMYRDEWQTKVVNPTHWMMRAAPNQTPAPAAQGLSDAECTLRQIAIKAVRDICETDPADPGDPDTILINVNDLRGCIDAAILAASRTTPKEGA